MDPLTITDTANQLRITRWTVHRLLGDAQLNAVHVGSVRHVDATSIPAFLHHHTVLPDRQEPTPMGTEIPKLYTLAEVAELHPNVLSLRTLSDDARARRFRHYHYGRRRFMDEDQIKELLRAKQVRPAEADALDSVRRRRARSAA